MKLLEAEKLIFRALTGLDSLASEGCPFSVIFAEVAYNYAVMCVQLGKRRKAGRFFEIAHRGLKSVLGGESMHALDALDWEIRCKSSVYQHRDRRSQADSIQMSLDASQQIIDEGMTSFLSDYVNVIGVEPNAAVDDETSPTKSPSAAPGMLVIFSSFKLLIFPSFYLLIFFSFTVLIFYSFNLLIF